MAILCQARAGRARRHAALAVAALSVGVALAWLLRAGPPQASAAQPVGTLAALNAQGAPSMAAVDAHCDARCAAAEVIVPASAACAAAIEELASFGVRWLDAGTTSSRFDRFAWLQAARGTVMLGGGRVEFRNAAGAWLPVDYDCDFDAAALAVIEVRARPRATAPVVVAGPADR